MPGFGSRSPNTLVTVALHRLTWVLRQFRPLVISEPCAGIGTAREVMKNSLAGFHVASAFDIDGNMGALYERLCAEDETCLSHNVYAGKSGDIMKVDVARLPDAEILCVGSPCQPSTSEGQRRGALDERSLVTESLVNWIAELAWRGCLTVFFIENSPEIQKNTIIYSEGFLKMIQDRLETLIPFFLFDVVLVDLGRFLPHSRHRLFLRGLRLDAAGLSIPGPLSLDRPFTLRSVLDQSKPCFEPSEFTTAKKLRNYEFYVGKIKDDLEKGITVPGQIAVFDIDRAAGCVRRAQVLYDRICSLKCKGPFMFVMSTEDLHLSPSARQYHRFIDNGERFLLQGQDSTYNDVCKTKQQAMMATGNACSTFQTAAVLMPMVEKAIMTGALDPKEMKRKPKEALWDMAQTKMRRMV